ncbi:MAG: PD-(D/E)XK nuclease family protein [Candidatus Liptonbacteria bacterium]|nr:PD-(D/E)XK nuclease family protein [Candidatus Liptonbacteria bacterium]
MKTKEGLWKLSPSGLYGFEECRTCFWLEHHHTRAPGLPFVLNMAMDSVLKSRYDAYREKEELPPEIQSLGNEGITLFRDIETLNKWRGSTMHLRVVNEKVGYEIGGKLDEVLIEKNGRLIPTDFKSSGYAPKEDKQKYYVSQLTAYAFMFQKHELNPSDRAILLHYFLKDPRNPSLQVEFISHIDPVRLDLPGFENKLEDIVGLLNGPYPGDNLACEKCLYYAGRNEKSNPDNR